MFSKSSLTSFLALALYVSACADHGDGHDHGVQRRADTAPVITAPTTPLTWGDVNFLHTTDSHGWLLGHQESSPPEPNYSGTLGSFTSFVQHMKEIARQKNVDLLIIDSGDLHDGNGITDGGPPGSVDAHDANEQVMRVPYDVMAIGNHELYIYNNTLDMFKNFIPKFNGRYLSSNVNITVNGISQPVGERFAKIKTHLGRSVTALGVLYDFTDNDVGTTVQPVADMVKEPWFLNAIQEEPDFFLLVGHMPVRRDNWPVVFDAVRAVHPTTPIFIFGGHTHIRDCLQLDGRSMSLESGRYLETVGWVSANLKHLKDDENITFTRRYLDPNPVTYAFHTHKTGKRAISSLGASIDAGLTALSTSFGLSKVFGTAPQDYFLNRVPYPNNSSLLSLLGDEVMPTALKNETREGNAKIFITNSGEMRFDLFMGAFTKNDQLIVSPFDDEFTFLPDVPFSVASQVLGQLLTTGSDKVKRSEEVARDAIRSGASHDARAAYGRWMREMYERSVELGRRSEEETNLTLGYVTSDSCPGVGDDTLHAAIPFFSTPAYISSPLPTGVSDDTPTDLIFVNFIQSDVLRIVSDLSGKNVSASDVQLYTPVEANTMFEVFAQQVWN